MSSLSSSSSSSSIPHVLIHLPDAGVLRAPRGSSALEVLASASPELARSAIAVKAGKRWIDLRAPLEADEELRLVSLGDPEAVEVIRHSAEHVMADAVKALWPQARIDAGRSEHSEKFQYDIDLDHRIGPEDLARIEAKMAEIIASDAAFFRKVVSREEAKRLFSSAGEHLKVSRIDDIPEGEPISLFGHGGFVDLCRGPHVQRAGQIGAFKLLDVSGSYWRGDSNNPMLQRIYGIAFARPEELAAWEQQRREAELRDHRRLGAQLELFSIQEDIGGGLVLWHPKGALVRKLMEDYWRDEHLARGYQLVNTPHVGRARLWQTSGHLDFYREGMFAPMEIEGDPYYAKPMSCPFHVMVYKSRPRSYRELPLRLSELAAVYRYEAAGVLHGLMRVRGFTQDDSHIFCSHEQVEDEIVSVLKLALSLLRRFGFHDVKVYVATQPEKSVGSPELWAQAIDALKRACARVELPYEVDEGGGAFYGPKIDIKIRDAIGRLWQCSTVQFDFNLPERFDISYVGPDNKPRRPLMVHRALFGSLERFFGVLVEHHAGAFPLWLAPAQVRLLPVSDAVNDYCAQVERELKARGIRVEVDRSNETLRHKIREAQLQKIPYMGVIGRKELAQGGISPRRRSGEELECMPVSAFADRLLREVAEEVGPAP